MTLTLTRPKTVSDALVLGGAPRVHLLPGEVDEARKAKGIRSRLLGVLVGVLVLAVGGVGLASLSLASATNEQSTQQAQTAALSAELLKYGSVTSIQGQLDDIKTVQPLATEGEILWAPYVATIQATLPAGTSIKAFTAKLDVASADTPESNPLVGTHVATLSVTANGPQAALSGWLASLGSVKGVVNATPGVVAKTDTPGVYTTNVDLLLAKSVAANRFGKVAK